MCKHSVSLHSHNNPTQSSSVKCVDNAGRSVVHWTASKANLSLMKVLALSKADLTLKDLEGLSPLDLAETRLAEDASGEAKQVVAWLKENATPAAPKEVRKQTMATKAARLGGDTCMNLYHCMKWDACVSV